MNEVGRRIHVPRAAHDDEHLANLHGRMNALHVHRHFTKPHDVRSKAPGFSAATTGQKFVFEVRLVHAPFMLAGDFAAQHFELTVHVEDIRASTALVEVVHVLGDEHHVAQTVRQISQRFMGGVGSHLVQLPSAGLIEPPDQHRVVPPGVRGCNVLNSMVFPQPVVISERSNAGLGRNPRTRQHHHARSPHDRSPPRTLRQHETVMLRKFHIIGRAG